MNFFDHFRKIDWVVFLSVLGLCAFGLISLYSSSLVSQDFSDFYKQICFVIVSSITMFVISFFDYRKLRENPALILLFYSVCVILLIGVLFMPEIRGISSWYKIGFLNFGPIEPMKIALILLLAKFFSKRYSEIYDFKNIIFSGFYVAVPCVLVFLQPDFGSLAIFLCIWFGILLVSGIRKKHFVFLILAFVFLFGIAFTFLMDDYQKNRIINFVSEESDSLGGDWNKEQARIAIGSGGFFGKGIGNGSQAQYGFLPEAKTDFIFSAIAEETGFVGVSFIVLLFILLFYRILKVSINARSNFARLFLAGFAISVFSLMFINISMNLGILPVVGLPLPFVSYGGSSLFFSFISLGILQSIKIVET